MPQVHKKILVIEDDVALSKALVDNLTNERFEVSTAEDGEMGFSSALRVKPDLILLDLLLPKADGMAVLRKLREKGGSWGKTVAVIILTNLTRDDEKRMRDIAGLEPTYYFEKANWNIMNVMREVKKVIAERELRQ